MNLKKMVSQFNDVFSGLGLIKSNATIHVDKNVSPVIDLPLKIPFAIQDQVRKELDRLIELRVITEPLNLLNGSTRLLFSKNLLALESVWIQQN